MLDPDSEEHLRERIEEYTKAIEMCEQKEEQTILKEILTKGLISMQSRLLKIMEVKDAGTEEGK